jgi:hypothetical protein
MKKTELIQKFKTLANTTIREIQMVAKEYEKRYKKCF